MLKGMYSKLPRSIKIRNERFIINTDFRIFINFEEEMTQGIDTKKAVNNALQSFYPAFYLIIQKGLINEAVDKFIWFYKCGKLMRYLKMEKEKQKKKVLDILVMIYIFGELINNLAMI